MSAPFIFILNIFSLAYPATPTESGRCDNSPHTKLFFCVSYTCFLKLGPKSEIWGDLLPVAFMEQSHTLTHVRSCRKGS